MVGTEKQVAWAEDIREGYKKVAAQLDDAAKTLRNLDKKETVVHDPLGGDRKGKTYAHKLTADHQAALAAASAIVYGADHVSDLLDSSGDTLRIEQAEEYEGLSGKLKALIDTEDSAKFWIDNRA